jgi:Tol biopolymer transport system component
VARKETLIAVGIALVVLPAAGASPGVTSRISVASASTQANGHSVAPAISADGRVVAFYSDASNLVPDDTNGARDVFVRDRVAGTTTRVSVGAGGAQGNSHSFAPAVSADGRFVAFHSHASNLVAGDGNGVDDVFVHDRQGGSMARVSLATGGAEENAGSYAPALSADGRLVAFVSDASNLVAGDTNVGRDVFVHDRGSGTTTRVSVSTSGDQGNVGSTSAAISGDGRYVAFASFDTNLVADDTNDGSDIFVRDRQAGTTTRVNLYPGGIEGDGDSLRPSISADGSTVAFDSDAWNLVWGDTNDVFDVFVTGRESETSVRVSVDDAGTQGNGFSIRPALSADGRFVTFYSEASNLAPGDTNGFADVFVHDRQSGATNRISVDNAGAEGNGDSLRPALNADGRLFAFESDATNLVAGDGNRFTDVFVHDPAAVPPPPPPAPPKVQCRVPRVIGLRLATARVRIRRANCQVGRVRRARSRRVGRVLSQSPRAGVRKARGTRVHLVVGRR